MRSTTPVEFFIRRSSSYTQARRHRRLPAEIDVMLSSGLSATRHRTSDISESGLQMVCPWNLQPMTLVNILLRATPASFELTCRVMWSAEGRAGLRFEQADSRIEVGLQHVKNHAAAGPWKGPLVVTSTMPAS